MRSPTSLLTLGLFALGACSSPNPYAGPQKQLAQDSKRIQSGEYQAAARDLERLLVSTDREDPGARLQALYAAHLLTQAHALASLGAPYLREPTVETGLGGGAPRHSGVGHVVAASMYAALGRELAANVDKAPREHKGVKLLPAEFDGFEPKDVRANLALFQMVALARLGFDERVRDFIAGSAELHSFEACGALLERLRVAPGLRPWIHASVFDYLRRSESTEPESYKFAVQALVASTGTGGAFDPRRREELATWIRSGSNYEYRCPEHRILVQPELGRCQEIGCERALFEFTPQRKQR
jgi:hypothetical protein